MDLELAAAWTLDDDQSAFDLASSLELDLLQRETDDFLESRIGIVAPVDILQQVECIECAANSREDRPAAVAHLTHKVLLRVVSSSRRPVASIPRNRSSARAKKASASSVSPWWLQ